ncbi:Tir chaperone protein (CesT) family protein [Pseudovibrio denitrificans]|uniref:Tir chaperone protein (CesT) family protein n=1 Tax=Pseudovibrio denitrificans TaxID=258256 RepID=A0A1I7DPV6_9HYPH|nr:type III secretion system chaperone [Pseudovibrio denitrificans]SFU13692.1 Tir chaperone protein (CesT) family protein [Pseudovibrio denitrificans]
MTDLVNALLIELGNRIGFDNFSLNEDGQIFLGLDQNLAMSIVWRDESQTLLFNSVISKQNTDDPQVLQALMQANCVFADSHSMAFNISPKERHINLSMVVTISDRSSFALHNKLDMFIRTAASWHERLKTPESLTPDWENSNHAPPCKTNNLSDLGVRV